MNFEFTENGWDHFQYWIDTLLKANYGFGLTKINSTEGNNSADDKNKYRTLSFLVGIPLGN